VATVDGACPAAAASLARKATSARLLGCALPKPQPPSRSWAITGPAHLPELKPQQEDAQSASEVQAPVINCVPWPATRRVTVWRMSGKYVSFGCRSLD
jgi:hypothetical protein